MVKGITPGYMTVIPPTPPKQGTVQNIKKHRKNITQSHLGIISKQQKPGYIKEINTELLKDVLQHCEEFTVQ